eukprot:scaffold1171_cov234-Pinguiococcus_pyrenoidosus.AAC.4
MAGTTRANTESPRKLSLRLSDGSGANENASRFLELNLTRSIGCVRFASDPFWRPPEESVDSPRGKLFAPMAGGDLGSLRRSGIVSVRISASFLFSGIRARCVSLARTLKLLEHPRTLSSGKGGSSP